MARKIINVYIKISIFFKKYDLVHLTAQVWVKYYLPKHLLNYCALNIIGASEDLVIDCIVHRPTTIYLGCLSTIDLYKHRALTTERTRLEADHTEVTDVLLNAMDKDARCRERASSRDTKHDKVVHRASSN